VKIIRSTLFVVGEWIAVVGFAASQLKAIYPCENCK
jgi:hypothetical protein